MIYHARTPISTIYKCSFFTKCGINIFFVLVSNSKVMCYLILNAELLYFFVCIFFQTQKWCVLFIILFFFFWNAELILLCFVFKLKSDVFCLKSSTNAIIFLILNVEHFLFFCLFSYSKVMCSVNAKCHNIPNFDCEINIVAVFFKLKSDLYCSLSLVKAITFLIFHLYSVNMFIVMSLSIYDFV